MSTELRRLSELATADKTTRFLSIAHRLTPAALMAAFESLRKDASAGVDGVTYREYERDVWRNIPTLHDRLVSHQYYGRPTNYRSLWRFYRWSCGSGTSGSAGGHAKSRLCENALAGRGWLKRCYSMAKLAHLVSTFQCGIEA